MRTNHFKKVLSMFVLCIFTRTLFGSALSKPSLLMEDACGMLISNLSQSQETFNYLILGQDYDDLPVLMLNWGAWDLLWLIGHEKKMERFVKNYERQVEEIETGVFFKRFNQDWPALHVVIINFDGLNFRQVLSPAVNKLTLELFMKFQRMLANISYGFILNANPIAHQVINMARPLVGNLLERYEVYGTNSNHWIPKLLKHIPANQLPPALGGHKDYKPVATCSFN